MTDLLYRILGIDPSRIPTDAQTDLVWMHAPQSWGIFVLLAGLAAAVWGVFWLYRHEIKTAPRKVRITLAFVRSAVVVILALVLLGPALAISQRRIIQPFIVLLLDDSSSMTNADHYADDASAQIAAGALNTEVANVRNDRPTRQRIVDHVLSRDDHQLLRELSLKGRVKVITFSNRLRELATLDAAPVTTGPSNANRGANAGNAASPNGQAIVVPQYDALGPTTNLSRAIRQTLKSLSRDPVAAIAIITDGQNTEGDDPAEAAEFAGQQHVPVFTVGVGDTQKPRNLAVAVAWPDQNVWRDDPFAIEVAVTGQGLGAATVPVELLEAPARDDGSIGVPDTGATVVARQEVTVTDAAPRVTASFQHVPKRAGKFTYTIRIPVQPNEWREDDNAAAANLTVRSEQARVLLVAGTPSWEYQLVTSVLQRDKSINLSCWLQSMDLDMKQEGNTPIDRLPNTAEALFKYDLIILLDPNPSPAYNPLELDSRWMELLRRFVGEHAGGVLYMAGPAYAPRLLSSPSADDLRVLLPVTLGESRSLDVEMFTTAFTRAWPVRLTPEGQTHPVTSFDLDPALNLTRWQAMPGIYWSLPAQRAKPGASVLLEHTDPTARSADGNRPLLVAGQYAGGRVLYAGFDGTWRWRSVGHDSEYFDKFWIQASRYLIEGRRMGSQRRGLITTDRERYGLGDPVIITAKLFDSSYAPLADNEIEGELKAGRDAMLPVTLRALPDRPGHYQATVTATQLGANELAVMLPPDLGSGQGVRIVKNFTVELPRVEFADPTLNKPLLVQMADRSGGGYFDIDQIAKLPAAVPNLQQTVVYREKPVELWDTATLLLIIAGLLTLEWALRKRFKLL